MSRVIKVIVIIALIVAAGFLIKNQLLNRTPADADLEEMRQSIIAEPVIKVDDLTSEQEQMFLDRFERVRENVLQLNFESLQGINEIAIIKKAVGDLEGAKVAWEYANIIRPQNSLSFANLAALYHYDFREYEKAEENYLISIANDPDDIPTIRNFFELYFYDFQDNAKAEALLLQSIENNPDTADLYSLTGWFYQETGRKDEALAMYQKHLELKPGNQAVIDAIERLQSN